MNTLTYSKRFYTWKLSNGQNCR